MLGFFHHLCPHGVKLVPGGREEWVFQERIPSVDGHHVARHLEEKVGLKLESRGWLEADRRCTEANTLISEALRLSPGALSFTPNVSVT